MMKSEKPAAAETPKHDSVFASLLLNLIAPILILRKGDALIENPAYVLVIALLFPIGYFIYDWNRRRKRNFISILGFLSVLMTGGIALLSLPRHWFLVKEALFPPGIIAIALLLSVFTSKPLIGLLFNAEMFDVDRIRRRLAERANAEQFRRTIRFATLLLGLSFVFSSVANFFLANHFVTVDPSDPTMKQVFNDQVGSMMVWTAVILLVPNMLMTFGILAYLGKAIKGLAGLEFEEALAPHLREKQAKG